MKLSRFGCLQAGMDLVEAVCLATKKFPKEEIYALSAQVRRAAFSIPSNIAEGQGRRSDKEFSRFLDIAHGSLREVETQILIAERLKYIDDSTTAAIMDQCAKVGRLITGLLNSINRTADQVAQH